MDYHDLTISDFASEQIFLPESLERAVHKRQIEFLLGRLCIKRCFEAFQVAPLPVLIASDRSPQWPETWVGSLSHSKGQVVAVLAQQKDYVGLGIDLETYIDHPSLALQTQICCDSMEIEDLQTSLGLTEQEALTLIFSSKESLYKLIHPRYKKFFGFQAARVSYREREGLSIGLTQHLNMEFPENRVWPVIWHRPTLATLETLLIEAAK